MQPSALEYGGNKFLVRRFILKALLLSGDPFILHLPVAQKTNSSLASATASVNLIYIALKLLPLTQNPSTYRPLDLQRTH